MLTPDGSVEQRFCELVAIPSPSGGERAVSDAVAAWLADAGVPTTLDGTGVHNDSDAGNLIASVEGARGALSLLFVAHLDTVESGTPAIEPVLGEDGVIRSRGETILGADNKSAVAAVMGACAFAAELDPARRPAVRGAFTCREEAGLMGVSLLALDGVDCAFSVDGSAPIGTTITRALGQQVFTVVVSGRAAHAAASPQDGVSAIAAAARAIAAVVAGAVIDHLDGPGRDAVRAAVERTPTNSVPDLALLRGEVRGYSVAEIEAARAAVQDAVAEACGDAGATYEWIDRERGVPPFPGVPDSRALALARAACAATDGVRFSVTQAHATLEANYLAAATDVVALASGGRDAHQPSESITVGELRALEALLCAIVREAARA
jgi:tripeptide aminopeptidase